MFTGFEDTEAWLQAQELFSGVSPLGIADASVRARTEVIAEEEVRLLTRQDGQAHLCDIDDRPLAELKF